MIRVRLPLLALSAVLATSLMFAPNAEARRGGGAGPAPEPTEAQKEVRALKHEIAVLELFQALTLSADQTTALASVISDVAAEQQTRQAERAEQAPKLQALLTRYLAEVKASGEPSAETVQALRDLRAAHSADRDGHRAARQQIKGELASILTEEQTEVLRSFRPMAAARPSDEEMSERREQRPERGERRGMGRHHAKKLLFSQAMLDLLD